MIKPTETELEILAILWKNGPSSVRQINEMMSTAKEVGYTTTLKLMQLMQQKGLLKRDESTRTHIYSAAMQQKDISKNMVSKLMNTVFSGSAGKLALSALGTGKASKEELEQIKALIKQMEDEQ